MFGASGTDGEEPNLTASALAGYSFSFDPNFATLPNGYLLNSTEAGIVNNTYSPPTPEPSTFVLGTAGLAGLGMITLRKKFRRA